MDKLVYINITVLMFRYRDIAPRNYGGDEGQPPRYTSNPSLPALPAGEYERPPPYYYPGPPAGGS